MAVQLARHRFTVDDYHRMVQGGVLPARSRVELIDGDVFNRPRTSRQHAATVDRLRDRLREKLGRGFLVQKQHPVRASLHSEPVPDVTVVLRSADGYRSGHPIPNDVLLLVEVAEGSLAYDRKEKSRVYARAGIADYWIVNLIRREIIVHRQPARTRFHSIQVMRRGDILRPLAFEDVELSVDEMLG
jgi:Uma2 family endonuclease